MNPVRNFVLLSKKANVKSSPVSKPVAMGKDDISNGVNEIIWNLKKLLYNIVKRNDFKNMLFSGGLDTSILAGLRPKAIGITVSLGYEAEDIHYSTLLASFLKMEHFHKIVDIDEAIEAIPQVVKILKSFDPAIPNDLVVYFGLGSSKKLGLDTIATGDGSDELFGGYSFMKDIDDLKSYIQKISERMSFSSNKIGNLFGIRIIQPFIDEDIINFALQIPIDLKIRKEKGKVWGKWILRKAFEDLLPPEIIWQDKRPLEYGSGMNKLRQVISDRVSDEEFNEDASGIKFMSKEHFYYYKIYKRVIGEIPRLEQGQKRCPSCGAGMKAGSFHCKVCGGILDWRIV